MKARRPAKSSRAPRPATTDQIVLDAYETATKDRAFLAFARRVLQGSGGIARVEWKVAGE